MDFQMNVTTQQYISLIGSETETLNMAVSVHLMDSTASLGSVVMQSLALYFESKQLVISVKKNDAAVIIDADDILTDFLRVCQDTIITAYRKMGDLIENDRLINPLNKMMMPISRWLLKNHLIITAWLLFILWNMTLMRISRLIQNRLKLLMS